MSLNLHLRFLRDYRSATAPREVLLTNAEAPVSAGLLSINVTKRDYDDFLNDYRVLKEFAAYVCEVPVDRLTICDMEAAAMKKMKSSVSAA